MPLRKPFPRRCPPFRLLYRQVRGYYSACAAREYHNAAAEVVALNALAAVGESSRVDSSYKKPTPMMQMVIISALRLIKGGNHGVGKVGVAAAGDACHQKCSG